MTNINNQQTATSKIGCRFTESEARLLDLLATATGETTSAYFRRAVKKQMLEDLLAQLGHNSTAKSEEEVNAAIKELQALAGLKE